DPRQEVGTARLEAVEDADVRDNYRVLLGFLARLSRAESVESCYLGIFSGDVAVPPLFIDQLAQIIVRGILDGCDDPLEPRAAELFFRAHHRAVVGARLLL